MSFPSEHTALSTVMTDAGWGWSYAFPLAVGAGRIAADKHHLSDVLAGGALGQALKWIPCS
jgi:membrane-associated phospholipid phosphatase